MNMNEINQYIDVFNNIDNDTLIAFKPTLGKILKLMSLYAEEFKPIVDDMNLLPCKLTDAQIKWYRDNGYTKKEAMLLSLNNKLSLKEVLKDYKINAKDVNNKL